MAKHNYPKVTNLIFIFLLAVGLFALCFFVFKLSQNNQKQLNETANPQVTTLKIGDAEITAQIAGSPDELTAGLSNRTSLAENSGMYFVLGERKAATFWMKDMLFPLDIIWIDGGKIVGIERNAQVPKNGNIPTFTSSQPVTNVLEVNARFTESHNIKVGDSVVTISP